MKYAEYKELVVIDDYYFDAYDLRNLGLANLPKPKKITYYGHSLFSDSSEMEVYDKDLIFQCMHEAGWEYKSTYWKGGSMGSATQVLCFARIEDEKNEQKWKPTHEQMNTLFTLKNLYAYKKDAGIYNSLNSLIEDLEKL